MKVYKIKQLNLNNIVYSVPRNIQHGKKIIVLGYNDPELSEMSPLIFQTTELYCGNTVEKINMTSDYKLDVPIYAKSDAKTKEFTSFLNNLNKTIMFNANKNKHLWFGNQNNIKYKSIIRKSTSTDKIFENGIIKLRLGNTNKYKTQVFTENKELVDLEQVLIEGTCYMKLLIELTALIIDNDSFELVYKVHQIGCIDIIKSYVANEYALVDDSNEYSNDEYTNLCLHTEYEEPTSDLELTLKQDLKHEYVADSVVDIVQDDDMENKIMQLKKLIHIDEDKLEKLTPAQITNLYNDLPN